MLTALGASYPAVGASGAISGVLGAYFVMHPNVRVRTLVSLGYFYRLVSVPAYLMIGLWFVYQLLLALTPIATGVAYWAHVGGFAVGLLVARLFRREELVTPIPDYDYYR